MMTKQKVESPPPRKKEFPSEICVLNKLVLSLVVQISETWKHQLSKLKYFINVWALKLQEYFIVCHGHNIW